VYFLVGDFVTNGLFSIDGRAWGLVGGFIRQSVKIRSWLGCYDPGLHALQRVAMHRFLSFGCLLVNKKTGWSELPQASSVNRPLSVILTSTYSSTDQEQN